MIICMDKSYVHKYHWVGEVGGYQSMIISMDMSYVHNIIWTPYIYHIPHICIPYMYTLYMYTLYADIVVRGM